MCSVLFCKNETAPTGLCMLTLLERVKRSSWRSVWLSWPHLTENPYLYLALVKNEIMLYALLNRKPYGLLAAIQQFCDTIAPTGPGDSTWTYQHQPYGYH